MKKIFCLLLSFLITTLPLTSCKDKGNSGKISLIVSNMYGTIKPVNIYEIIDGYMQLGTSKKKVSLKKGNNYCASCYSTPKTTTMYNQLHLLQINMTQLKLTIWDSHFDCPATGLTPNEDRIYYSEYWGVKRQVSFVTNVSYYKTIHIKLEEKSDTYKITYYQDPNIVPGHFVIPLSLTKIEDLNKHKKVIEVNKSDITKIEYFV